MERRKLFNKKDLFNLTKESNGFIINQLRENHNEDLFMMTDCNGRNQPNSKMALMKPEIDHYKPYSRGGSNEYSNMQILPYQTNVKKSNKDPHDNEEAYMLSHYSTGIQAKNVRKIVRQEGISAGRMITGIFLQYKKDKDEKYKIGYMTDERGNPMAYYCDRKQSQ